MSCMMTEEKTIERMINGIATLAKCGALYVRDLPASLEKAFPGLSVETVYGNDLLRVTDKQALFNALYEMNEKAYCECYSDATLDGTTYKVRAGGFGAMNDADILKQLYRDLSFFTYQCAEGEVFKSKQYKMMNAIKQAVALKLADVVTENMKWG